MDPLTTLLLSTSPVILVPLIAGIIVLLVAIGMGIYAAILNNRRTPTRTHPHPTQPGQGVPVLTPEQFQEAAKITGGNPTLTPYFTQPPADPQPTAPKMSIADRLRAAAADPDDPRTI